MKLSVIVALLILLAPTGLPSAVTSNCSSTAITQSITLTEDNACSSSNSTGSALFTLSSNVVFNCNGFSIGGNDLVPQRVLSVENATNVSILNCNIRSYSAAIYVANSSNFTIRDVNISNSTLGMNVDGNQSTIERIAITNTGIPLQVAGGNNHAITNVSIKNATSVAQFSRVGITTNNSVFSGLEIHNSSHFALLIYGNNNTFSVNITGTNGTGITVLNGAANNSITLVHLANNNLDLNVTDSSGTSYDNNFNGNFSTAFFNVSNANSAVATLNNIALSANTTFLTINLTISNSSGIINLTNRVNYFNLSNNTANLDSTLYPFLSQPAVITFSAVSYANTSIYEILRDGSVCSDSICTKISASPVSFRVTGFSNYSTRAIQVNTSNSSNSTNSSSTSSSNSTLTSSTNSTSSSTASTTPNNSTSGDQTEANAQSSSQSSSPNTGTENAANTTGNSTANSTLGSALAEAWLNKANERGSSETPTLLSGLFTFATTTAQPWTTVAVLAIVGTIGIVAYNKFYPG